MISYILEYRTSVFAACMFFLASFVATAQEEGTAGPVPIDITAESVEYLDDQQLIIGVGNVVVRDGDATLRADYMSLNNETMDVHAKGNVFYQKGGETWSGDEFSYNMKTRTGDFGSFNAFFDPFYLTAQQSKKLGMNDYELSGLKVTTCEGEHPIVYVKAGKGSLIDNRIKAKNVVFYFGFLPYFYLPSYSRSLDPNRAFWVVLPGYSSRMGAFLLSGYHIKWNPNLTTITRLDYRSERGVGVGQDFEWQDNDDSQTWEGAFRTYYISDNDPLANARSEENRTDETVDSERYRIKLNHFQTFSSRDYFIGEFNYLSDIYVLEDFFNEEFRENVQPENRATLTHRGDQYTAAITLNKRLNDFYENVDRLPEITLDVSRQQLGDSGFYYESENSASHLTRVFPDASGIDEYDSLRIDSRHTVYYPTRNFGFLNIIPRAGARGTYYSDTIETVAFNNTLVQTDSNGVSVVVTNSGTTVQNGGSDLRTLYELGWEGSFKAFKTWNDLIVLGNGDGLRHIAEPYLDHTYLAEPSVLPENLPQFDSIDTLDKRHDMKLGMRNKWQTRRGGFPVDLVDVDVFTYYRLEKEETEEDFSDVFFDTELRLSQFVPVDFDGAYDTYEGELSQFSTQIGYYMTDLSRVNVEYRYRRESQSLFQVDLSLFPESKWSFEAYARYDEELSELEEHAYLIKHRGECLGTGLGYKQVEDDITVYVQLWLTAFPETTFDLGL